MGSQWILPGSRDPVVVHNLMTAVNDEPLWPRNDGYTSCPPVTGYGGLILAAYVLELTPRETFAFD